jgi:cytidyltransferase-like protein
LLHANHVAFLEEARSHGARLVVGVVSDKNVLEYKRRPVMTEDERLQVVSALRCVDEAFIIRPPLVASTMEDIMSRHGIGAVVYAGNATPDFYRPAEARGVMHRLPYRAGVNSSDIIERIVARHRAGEF